MRKVSTNNQYDYFVQRELVNTEVMKSLNDLDANLVLNKEVPISSVKVSAIVKEQKDIHRNSIKQP